MQGSTVFWGCILNDMHIALWKWNNHTTFFELSMNPKPDIAFYPRV